MLGVVDGTHLEYRALEGAYAPDGCWTAAAVTQHTSYHQHVSSPETSSFVGNVAEWWSYEVLPNWSLPPCTSEQDEDQRRCQDDWLWIADTAGSTTGCSYGCAMYDPASNGCGAHCRCSETSPNFFAVENDVLLPAFPSCDSSHGDTSIPNASGLFPSLQNRVTTEHDAFVMPDIAQLFEDATLPKDATPREGEKNKTTNMSDDKNLKGSSIPLPLSHMTYDAIPRESRASTVDTAIVDRDVEKSLVPPLPQKRRDGTFTILPQASLSRLEKSRVEQQHTPPSIIGAASCLEKSMSCQQQQFLRAQSALLVTAMTLPAGFLMLDGIPITRQSRHWSFHSAREGIVLDAFKQKHMDANNRRRGTSSANMTSMIRLTNCSVRDATRGRKCDDNDATMTAARLLSVCRNANRDISTQPLHYATATATAIIQPTCQGRRLQQQEFIPKFVASQEVRSPPNPISSCTSLHDESRTTPHLLWGRLTRLYRLIALNKHKKSSTLPLSFLFLFLPKQQLLDFTSDRSGISHTTPKALIPPDSRSHKAEQRYSVVVSVPRQLLGVLLLLYFFLEFNLNTLSTTKFSVTLCMSFRGSIISSFGTLLLLVVVYVTSCGWLCKFHL